MDQELSETQTPSGKPALVINIYSWATPIAAMIMLILGLVAGFYAYPLFDQRGGVAIPTALPTSITEDIQVTPTDAAAAATAQASLMEYIVQNTYHFIGDESAPVTMIEFSDFQCPYCGKFSTGAGRQIFEEYVETGKVRFGYAHFTFLGDESILAAEASECAGDQDKFWEFHDLIFEMQASGTKPSFSAENLKKMAADLGLKQDEFDACLDSGKYTELVNNQTGAFQSIGVSSTPSFIINGQPIVGAQSFENFQLVIEAELAK